MSKTCNLNCGSCSEDCGEWKADPQDFREALHAMSSVKKVIGIVSGKGEVEKSL